MLCALVWALCAATILESFWVLGLHGWRFAVVPLAVSAVVWMLLWAPRVVVRPGRLEIRNVVVTHMVPMTAIEDVRLGAMLRVILPPRTEGAKPEVITAWNAPGVGKDRPRDRIAGSDVRSRYSQERSLQTATSTWSERLVRDQRTSPSYAVVEAWERSSRDEVQRSDGSEHGDRSAGAADAPGPSRHLNTVEMLVVAVSLLLPAARMLT